MRTFFNALLCVSLALPIIAQQKTESPKSPTTGGPMKDRVWGMVFSDFSYIVKDSAATKVGKNDFNFRRVYLGFDHDFDQSFAGRVLFETRSDDFTVGGSLGVFLKSAYLEWRDAVPMSSVYLGMVTTPAIVGSEKAWGYRSLEKSLLDKLGFISSTDVGISMRGMFVPDGSFGYAVMVGNGTGIKPETDKLKRMYGSITYIPVKGFCLDGYADYENIGNAKSKITGRLLASYETTLFGAGIEVGGQLGRNCRYDASAKKYESTMPLMASVYNWDRLEPNVRAVFRIDFYDPDYNLNSAGIRRLDGIAAIDYFPSRDVHIMPNILYTHWLNKDSKAAKADDAIQLRLTIAYTISRMF